MRIHILPILSFMLFISLNSNALAQQVPPFPSAREVEPQVLALVDKLSEDFKYLYTVSNGQSALQNMWQFLVEIRTEDFSNFGPAKWRPSNIKRPIIKAVTWGSRDPLQDITPGGTLSGFGISSSGQPSIVKFFVRGFLEPPRGEFDFIKGTNDIFFNSVEGFTIGPADPPVPFDASTFLDTLKSYTTQSLTLGWIADEPTADKYEGHFSTAQTELQQADTTAARSELQTVLQEVNQDSGSVLTSEAYALLRFNTEYLLDQLPVTVISVDIDIKPGSDPNSINPKSKGVIPVAVLTDQNFDATMVDVSTVVFGPAGAQPVHKGHIEDVDGDGDDDLLLHFNTQDTGIQCGDAEATLSGATFGGQAIEGSDSIKTVGCK